MALTYLFTQKHINYMLLNWIDVLFDYDFTVVHRPGIHMILPDALSRIYQETPDEKEADTNCSNVKKIAAVTTS